MERGRGQLVEDGEEKGPEQPEGEVEDEPDDDDGEEPRGRGRGVAYLVVSVLRPALSGGGTG